MIDAGGEGQAHSTTPDTESDSCLASCIFEGLGDRSGTSAVGKPVAFVP